MKTILLFALTLSMVSIAEAGRGNRREHKQDARIAQGVKSGELNRRETKKLMKGQKRIDRFQKKAMEDGSMSAEEKVKLEKMQDRQSKRIYKQKHDEQQRGDHAKPPSTEPQPAPVDSTAGGE